MTNIFKALISSTCSIRGSFHYFIVPGNPEVLGGGTEAEGARARTNGVALAVRAWALWPVLLDGGTALAACRFGSVVDASGPREHARGCAGRDRYGSGVAVGPASELASGPDSLSSRQHRGLLGMSGVSRRGPRLWPPLPPHPSFGPAPGTCPWPPTATCGSWAGAATGR